MKIGLYDIINQKLIEHSPLYFTTCQIHAEYKTDFNYNNNIANFLDDITCNNWERKQCLLQYIGYSMTYSTDLEKALILYRTNCKKSEKVQQLNS